jgi:hypothetical protein
MLTATEWSLKPKKTMMVLQLKELVGFTSEHANAELRRLLSTLSAITRTTFRHDVEVKASDRTAEIVIRNYRHLLKGAPF